MTALSEGHAPFEPMPAAKRIAEAWAEGGLLTELPPAERPRTLADAYAVQADLQRRIGEPFAGYKLGSSNRVAMRKTGLGKPIHGFMTKPRVFADGIELAAPRIGKLVFELEVCFVIGDTVPVGASPEAKVRAMAGAHLGIELVSSRFVDRAAVGLPTFLADNIGFRAYILGDAIDRSSWPAIFQASAQIARNGIAVAPGLTDESRTDPVEALSLFIDDAAEKGLPLEKGMLVTTGSIVATYESAETGRYLGQLGKHSVSCTIVPSA